MFDSTLSNNTFWSLDHLNAALDPVLLGSTSDSTGISVQNQSSSNYGFDETVLLQTASALSRQSSLSTGNGLSTLSSTLADLIITSGSLGAGVAGSYYNFSYTIKNQGSSVTSYSSTNFYLSKNTTLDTGDIDLGYDYVASLSAGVSTTESVSVSLNNSIEPGNYYLLGYADADSNVTESNESNNLVYFTTPISISASDNAGNTLSSARTITVGSSPTIYNDWVGSTDTNDYYKFSLSNTSNFNLTLTGLSSDAEVELLNSSGTKVTESANSGTNNESITRQLSAGTYYIRVYPYSGNTYYNLNVSATTVGNPDLIINSISATTGVIGSPLNFTYTIKNQGNGTAGTSNTAFYLSTNTTFDSSDTYLGVDNVASLAVGASSTESASFALANTLTAGTYYLLAKADNGNSVIESNENNNLVYQTSPITLQSPITISISANDTNAAETDTGQTANPGQFTVTRIGDLTNSLKVNYGVSGTATNGIDYNSLSGSVNFAAGASTATINVTPINDNLSENPETVIVTLASGTGYTLGTNKSATINLVDNDFAITVTSPNGGQTFNTGSSYNITWTDNISENVKIDLYKGGTFLRTLFTSTASDGSETWTVPDNLTPGSDYKIRIVSVNNNTIADFSDANFSIAIPPRPDLVIVNPQGPAILDPVTYNFDFSYSYTLKNQGEATAYGSYGSFYIKTEFYLSKNTSLSNDDVYLGSDTGDLLFMPSLAPNNSVSVSDSFILQNQSHLKQLAGGTYYMIYKIDSDNKYVESNENNNISYRTINLVKPDLVIENASAPSIAQIGGNINVSYRLKNKGQGTAESINYTQFYLSKDATVSADDIYLDSDSAFTELDSSEYITRNVSINISNSITAGTYYLFFHADGSQKIVESNENNNLAYVTLQIPVYSSTSGYGLVNAAAAVAKALNQNPFPNVATWGGTEDWGANMINAPEVWAKGYTGKGIIVAVLDSGVDYNHVDLKGNIWTNSDEIAGDGIDNDKNGYIDDVRGWDFAFGDNNPMDVNGHGTHVAGTIAASRNSFGVTGIAYNAKIMPVKVLNDDVKPSSVGNSVINGIYYAVINGAKVINMSLGGGYTVSNEDRSALEYAASKGVIVVIAAGNDFEDHPDLAVKPLSPALYATNRGIAVGAVDSDNDMTSFSNRAGSNSSMAYVTAPGYSIYSTIPSSYGYKDGTSMAAPHVAGVVALMLSAKPNLTDAQVRQILTSTSDHNVLGSTTTSRQSLSTVATKQSTQNIVAQSFNANDSTLPVSSKNPSPPQKAIAPIPSSLTHPIEESTQNIIARAFTPELDDEVIGKTPLFILDDLLTAGLIA